MNSFQIIVVSLAAALGLSVFAGPAWEYLKDVFLTAGKNKSILDRLEPDVSPHSPSLVEVVKEWEDLKEVCKKAQLHQAVEQLDSIFPLLNSGGKNV